MNLIKKDVRQKIYRIIRIGYIGDAPSRIFDMIIVAAILINLFIIFFETFEESVRFLPILNVIEFATILIFTVEYILRLVTADLAYPSKNTFISALFAFVFSLYGMIDLLSFAPYWVALAFPAAAIPSGAVAFRMLRVVRILRLFRINRYYDAFNVITDVLKEKKNQIASAVFIILMLVIASSILMYNIEHEAQPDQFRNAFSGIWWAVSTLLTVGYGDIYPVTAAGRFVGIILAFLGVGIVAIPTGIMSAGFVQQYTKIKDLAGTSDESPLSFITIDVTDNKRLCGMKLSDVTGEGGPFAPAIIRDGALIRPDADTVLCAGDRLIISDLDAEESDIMLGEIAVRSASEWVSSKVGDFDRALGVDTLLIKREGAYITPSPDDLIAEHDAMIFLRSGHGGRM